MEIPSGYELTIDLAIRPTFVSGQYTNDRLSVSDRLTLQTRDFLSLAKILGQFTDLTDRIRAREAGADQVAGVTEDDVANRPLATVEMADIVATGCTIDDVVLFQPRLAARVIRALLEDEQ